MTDLFKQSINLTLPILLVLLLGTPTQATANIDTTALVGNTAGSFSVNQGTANYAIPITVPPGIAGMKPELSINYNSNMGNGQLGVGFSLGGLSTIHRCTKTIVTDGVKGGVNYDDHDKYCLNGQRLIVISGTDGQPSSEYRTEMNSFSKIKYNGNYWTVKTKSGQTFKYGNTQNSKIEAQGKSIVRLWAVNKIIDATGNAINYVYNENNANGEYTLSSINYADSSIGLTYEGRSDVSTSYQVGSKLRQTKRLSNITTYVNNNIVRTYDLEYQYYSTPKKSQLISIKECVNGQCLPKTEFEWKVSNMASWQSAPQYTPLYHIAADNAGDVGARFQDVNGDGLVDMIYHRWIDGNNTQKGAYLNTGNGWQSAPQYTPPYHIAADNAKDLGARFQDVNGDGLVDMIYHRWIDGNNTQKGAYLNTGNGWQSAPQYTPPYHIAADNAKDLGARFQDVNGDGLVDMIYHRWIDGNNTQKGAYLNTGNGWQSAPQYTPPYHIAADNAKDLGARFQDVNGDGLVDMIYHRWIDGNNTQKGAYLNTGNGWQSAPQYTPPYHIAADDSKDTGVRFQDLNGDGLVDMIYRRWIDDDNTQKGAYLNTGNGWQSAPQYTPPHHIAANDTGDVGMRFQDLNGDGLVDMIYRRWIDGNNTQKGAYLNTGNGWQSAPQYTPPHHIAADDTGDVGVRFQDLNGDGLVDMIYRRWIDDDSTQKGAYLNTGNIIFKLTSITNGFNIKTTINYKPLTNPSVYTKGTNGNYPNIDTQNARQVVSSVVTDNAIGGQSTTTYKYGNAKVNIKG
ncbi:FG-GAP-like repeat-containing protein, partial [Bathymodiolus thermophilus thioautotrophic gill symbiont]